MYGPFGDSERNSQISLSSSPAYRANILLAFVTLPLRAGQCFRDRIEARLRDWRWGSHVELWSLLVLAATPVATNGSERAVRFDVPALAIAVPESNVAVTEDELIDITVTIPVTTEIRLADRNNIEEFRYDVKWNRHRYPLTNYGPRTQTTSHIDGSILIESIDGTTANAGLTLTGGQPKVLSGAAKAEWVKRDETKTRYSEVPQHDVLVASGTIERGTGAFFRFHRSRKETLEGARDLQVVFRVPADWRAGLLQVECLAVGQRQIIGTWNEPFDEGQIFVLPIYRDGDRRARDLAVKLVRTEQGLRSRWTEIEHRRQPVCFESTMRTLFSNKPAPQTMNSLDSLIRSGRDQSFEQLRGRLPDSVAAAVAQYVNAKKELLELSR